MLHKQIQDLQFCSASKVNYWNGANLLKYHNVKTMAEAIACNVWHVLYIPAQRQA